MFLIDKYSPKNIDDAYFHRDKLDKLKIMSEDESMPHIIFYGPPGSGKKTIIRLFLEMLYDKNVNNLKETDYIVMGSGNSATHVTIKQSNYHIVIEPNNNNFDRYLIQDVVKEYARRVPLDVFTTKKIFKTVLINNIDNLSYYAQTSLRRTLEKYSRTCRFIMWSRSLTKVIEPLRSRCYSFRVNSPSEKEMFNMLIDISSREKIELTMEKCGDIIQRSNNNVKIALWLLELTGFGEDLETTYDKVINIVIKHIKSNNIGSILIIRDLLYKIMITNISGTYIIKDIVDKLVQSDDISEKSKIEIVDKSAQFEHNLVKGRREIIHLDGFIASVMRILNTEIELGVLQDHP